MFCYFFPIFAIISLGNSQLEEEVSVNCDNAELMGVLTNIGLPFRCIQSNEIRREKELRTELESGSLQPLVQSLRNLPPYLRCKYGTIYSTLEDACIPIPDLEVRSLIDSRRRNPKQRCSSGMYFNPVTNSCHPTKSSNCPVGTIYNPSLNLCLDTKPKHIRRQPSIKRERPQADVFVASEEAIPIKINFFDRRKCPPGSIYLSEIDICSEIR